MMNRSDIEQLTDELIGQAVLTLLKRKAAVNSMAPGHSTPRYAGN